MAVTLLILSLFALVMGTLMLLARRGAERYLFNTATPLPDPPAWPAVAALVPGRNEGHILAGTLGSLCAMDYPNLKVVFVDDQSTDDTPAVCEKLKAEFPHLTVIRNTTPPPTGWCGKVWAVHQARAHATADMLLFCDSDLHFHPQALRQMVRLAHAEGAALTSSLPRMDNHTPFELLGIAGGMLLINTALPLRAANDPRSEKALAAGGFSLWRREAYVAVGGHEAVRGQVIEDIALCTRAKAQGLKTHTVVTHDIYRTRMYEGLRDTFRGLRKNAFAGVHYSYAGGINAVVMMVFGMILTPAYAVAAAALWVAQPSVLTFFACAAAVTALAVHLAVAAKDARLHKFPAYTPLLFPFALTFYLIIFIAAMIDYARGGPTWAGRRLAAEHAATLKAAAGPGA